MTGDGYIYVTPAGELPGATRTVMAEVAGDGTFATPPLDTSTTRDLFATDFPGRMSAWTRNVSAGTEDVEIVPGNAGRIEGRVLDSNGKPVPEGVPVIARAKGIDASASGASSVAYTGADGTFALEGLREYDYALRAGGGESAFRPGPERAGVRAGAEDVVLTVQAGVTLSGRVLDAEGRPVRAATITGRQEDSVSRLVPQVRVRTDEGRFELRCLSPGEVRL